MSTDDKITADLAVVARASRSRPRPLETTLQKLGVRTEPRSADRGTRVSLAVAPIYATRLARIAAGGYLLLAIITRYLVIALGSVDREDFSDGLLPRLLDRDYFDLAISFASVTAMIYFVVWRWALGRAERAPRRDHANRLERWSMFFGVAGPLAFVMFFGLLRVVLGPNQSVVELVAPGASYDPRDLPTWWWSQRDWAVAALGASLGASVVGTMIAVRLHRIGRWTEIVALFLFGTTVFFGMRSDPGPVNYAFMTEMLPDLTVRTAMLVVGSLSLVVVFAAFGLTRRSREIAALDGE